MNSVICPCCGATIEPLGSGPRVTVACLTCGWNYLSARRVYRNELLRNGTLLILALFFLALRPALSSDQEWLGFVIVTASVVVMVCTVYWKTWKVFRRAQPVPGSEISQVANGGPMSADAFAKLIPSRQEAGDVFSSVLNVPRPRPIEWGWPLKAAAALLVLILTFSIWATYAFGYSGNRSGLRDETVPVMFLLALGLLIGLQVVVELPKWRLLKVGEVTVGRVVYQRRVVRGRRGSISSIVYAFVDGGSRPFIGQGRDYTNKIGAGAPVVVFYNPFDPSRNVSLECCKSRVKTGQ
jgi:hypothetical protein